MDRLFILMAIYITGLYICTRQSCTHYKNKKYTKILSMLSTVIVAIGCLTPINMTCTFLIAYALLIIILIIRYKHD